MTSDPIDRIAPTLRPDGSVIMRQNWHHLLFLHWPVPADKLRPLVPSGLEIDTHDGNAWVGLIPFTITGTRPLIAPPVPFLSDFHEVNVRTYVHRNGQDPGVWFFSLDASSMIAVAAARALYHLDYYTADIQFSASDHERPTIDFDSSRTGGGQLPANCHIRYGAIESPATNASPGSLEHFLIERYILYARNGDQLYRARVHHPAYPLGEPYVEKLDETLVWAAGITRPESGLLAHYSRGVEVEIFRPEKL